jgi:hypothetical protein
MRSWICRLTKADHWKEHRDGGDQSTRLSEQTSSHSTPPRKQNRVSVRIGPPQAVRRRFQSPQMRIIVNATARTKDVNPRAIRGYRGKPLPVIQGPPCAFSSSTTSRALAPSLFARLPRAEFLRALTHLVQAIPFRPGSWRDLVIAAACEVSSLTLQPERATMVAPYLNRASRTGPPDGRRQGRKRANQTNRPETEPVSRGEAAAARRHGRERWRSHPR